MPKLRGLQLIISFLVGNEIWKHILPEYDEHGKRIEILQIETLSISYTTSDCDSSQITRLYNIFPNLTIFQHTIKDGDNLKGCEHRVKEGKLIQKRCLKKYAQRKCLRANVCAISSNYFKFYHQIRNILKITKLPEKYFKTKWQHQI